eukprot:TRINITY_DN4857_c0_g1_i1.p1 TRINITY_DN4857_c0_g1~~TRINITY_DN4857_c0_g1_i1.p1  ORF type:complete len:290 (-),score=47.08 TRINITY_DN4857_c0_g1_i1:79-849(-)
MTQAGLMAAQSIIPGYFNYDLSWTKKVLQYLKFYFKVDNMYVLNKLKVLLFPFRRERWGRDPYQPPNQEINAPDLYIPVMAFITYIILFGFAMSNNFKFTPDTLGKTMSTGSALIMFEVLLLKSMLFLCGLNSNISILDIVAYTGYIFVGAAINVMVGICLGNYGFYISLFLTSLFMATFLKSTLKAEIPRPADGGSQATRNYLLLSVMLLQFFFMFFLCVYDYGHFSTGVSEETMYQYQQPEEEVLYTLSQGFEE